MEALRCVDPARAEQEKSRRAGDASRRVDRCGSLVLRSGLLLSMTVIETVRRPSYECSGQKAPVSGSAMDPRLRRPHAYGAGMTILL